MPGDRGADTDFGYYGGNLSELTTKQYDGKIALICLGVIISNIVDFKGLFVRNLVIEQNNKNICEIA